MDIQQLPPSPVITNNLRDMLSGQPVEASENQIAVKPFAALVLTSGDSPCANVMSAR